MMMEVEIQFPDSIPFLLAFPGLRTRTRAAIQSATEEAALIESDSFPSRNVSIGLTDFLEGGSVYWMVNSSNVTRSRVCL